MYKGDRGITFNEWIFDTFPVSVKGLSLYRIFAAGYILLFLVPDPSMYRVLSGYPSALYDPPPGLMQLFSSFPPEWFFWSVHIVLVVSLLSLLIGYKCRFSAILAGVCFIILKGFIYSLGKINHDLLIMIVLFTFAFSKWDRFYAISSGDKRKNSVASGWPITLIALFIGFMMLTAGIPKILGGWLDPETHAVYSRFVDQFITKERQDLMAEYALKIRSGLLWESLDYMTIIFEVGFIFAIQRRSSALLFTAFAVLFHFSTMLLINITFIPNFIAYAAFLDWTWIHQKLERFTRGLLSAPLIIAGFLAVIKVIGLILNSYFSIYLKSDMLMEEVLIVCVGCIIAVSYLLKRLIRFRNDQRIFSDEEILS